MSGIFRIGTVGLRLDDVAEIMTEGREIALSRDAQAAVKRSHAYLRKRLREDDRPIYG